MKDLQEDCLDILSITLITVGTILLSLAVIFLFVPEVLAVPARVTYLYDGDTGRVNVENFLIDVRFSCIDTPAIARNMNNLIVAGTNSVQANQHYWGIIARNRTKQLIDSQPNKTLNFTPLGLDEVYNRRNIAQAQLPTDNTYIEQKLVTEGLAVMFPQYQSNCPQWQEWLLLQDVAKTQQLGFWADSKFMLPFEFRKRYPNF